MAALKHGQPGSHLTWVVEPQWAPLLEGNPFVDRVLLLRREFGRGAAGQLAGAARRELSIWRWIFRAC